MTTPKLVIFDKDGLMMDTESPVFAAWKEVFSEWGLPLLTKEFYARFIGMDGRDNIRQMEEAFPDADTSELLMFCRDRSRAYLQNNPIKTMPGLFELFDTLDEKGIKKIVATSSGRESSRLTLEKCGILPRVDAVFTGDMVERGKPAPDIFLLAAKTMGVHPSECLVLEDSNAGVMAAHAAGMKVIVIPDMTIPTPEILALCVCKCVSLFDVIELL